MKTIIIKDQAHWDSQPKRFDEFTVLEIREGLFVIKSVPENSRAELRESSRAVLWGSSRAVLRESSSAELWESSRAELRESSRAVLWGSSRAVLRESSSAELWESSRAELRESSRAELRESSSAELWESSRAVLRGSSSAELWESSRAVLRGSSSAVLRGSSSAELWESSRAVLRGSSSAVLWGSSRAELRESSSAVLWGSSRAELRESSGCHCYDESIATLFAFSVARAFGKSKALKKAKTATIIKPVEKQFASAKDWLDKEGVTISGKAATIFKRVSGDFKTQEKTSNETLWAVGSTVTHHNWDPNEKECGEGKFHACSRPYFCDEFRSNDGDKYIAIRVNVADMKAWPGAMYPHKIAFRSGVVLYECDSFGEKISAQNPQH